MENEPTLWKCGTYYQVWKRLQPAKNHRVWLLLVLTDTYKYGSRNLHSRALEWFTFFVFFFESKLAAFDINCCQHFKLLYHCVVVWQNQGTWNGSGCCWSWSHCVMAMAWKWPCQKDPDHKQHGVEVCNTQGMFGIYSMEVVMATTTLLCKVEVA